MKIGNFNVVKRDFFIKGDLVSPVHNMEIVYEFIKTIGFSTVKLRKFDDNMTEFEYDIIDNDPLTFADGFDPGMISAYFA